MTKDLLLVGFSLLAWGFGENAFFFFQPIYLEQLGANPLLIGTIFSAFGLVMMAAHIPAGYLADRIGRRPLMTAAWLTGLSATVLMAMARNLTVFVIGMLLYGLTAFVSSPLFSYVTAARGNLTAGRAMTLTSAMYNLGAVLGPLVGGVVGEHYSLRSLYWIAVVFFIISNIIMFFTRPQPRDQFDPDAPPERLFSNPRYLTFLFVSFAAMFAMFLPQTLTPNFLQNERGISLVWLGRLGSLGSLGNVVSNLVIGQMSVRLGFLISQLAVVLFAILLWQGSGLAWYGLGYFLLGGYRSARMLVFAQVRSLIHVSQMGIAYGITEAVNAFAIILAPLLAGYLYEGSPVSMFPVTVGLLVFSFIVSAVLSPRDQKPEPITKTSSLQR